MERLPDAGPSRLRVSEMASMIDPVCGMSVEAESAAAAWEYRDVVYYFCSVRCMERFRDDPEHFLALDPSERSM
jgi:YHS domain-containing protein